MVIKNRSRVEILYDIVSAAKPCSKKTHLMYRGNLSYQQLDLYLNFILKNGLLEERTVDDARLYFITPKGIQFLKLFEDMHSLVSVKREVNGGAVESALAREEKSNTPVEVHASSFAY